MDHYKESMKSRDLIDGKRWLLMNTPLQLQGRIPLRRSMIPSTSSDKADDVSLKRYESHIIAITNAVTIITEMHDDTHLIDVCAYLASAC